MEDYGQHGNYDGGFSFIGIYGNGLTATAAPSAYGAPSAFWADSVVSPNIPVILSLAEYLALPAGALYTNVPPGSGYLSSQVYVA